MCIYSVFSVSCRLQQNNERYHQPMYFLFIVHHIHNISYNLFTQYSKKIYTFNILGHLKKMFWFSDNGFQKKGKVGRVLIFCFYFQSNMGRVFIFCFYFQRFKNITQTSSILLFWQTNNTIVFTLSTGQSTELFVWNVTVLH